MSYPIDPMYAAIREKFPWVRDKGIYNCRKIRTASGTGDVWSQHSWGRAVDIYDPADSYDSVRMDQVVAWLRAERRAGRTVGGLKVGRVLWKIALHHDHAHVEMAPYLTGVPPCAGGEEEVKPEDIQKALAEAGYDIGSYSPAGPGYPPGADGQWGAKSQAALTQAFKDARTGNSTFDPSGLVTKDVFNAHRHSEGVTGTPR